LYATQDLKHDHIAVRRLKNIIERCCDTLCTNQDLPIEDIEIISVVIEEFVDRFHHGKEEQAYFPGNRDKNGFAEDIRKFLIEHELGRRIAMMLRREIKVWKQKRKERREEGKIIEDPKITEPVSRFLKSYAAFITDHTRKEDNFFDLLEQKGSISTEEDEMLLQHYEVCRNQVGGKARIEQMIRLIEYLEDREWMKERK
jgi:hemerythrin-like domain-containing protein